MKGLETNFDSVDQYERRGTIIVSGLMLPEEAQQKNTDSTFITTIREYLKVNIREADINIAHRIGPVHYQRKRPITVKLSNRSLKHDLVGACIRMKPQLYMKKSFTTKQIHLFKQVFNVRKAQKDKFQHCNVKDGKIIVKLKNSTVRHEVFEERALLTFLDKYPCMLNTYGKIVSSSSAYTIQVYAIYAYIILVI